MNTFKIICLLVLLSFSSAVFANLVLTERNVIIHGRLGIANNIVAVVAFPYYMRYKNGEGITFTTRTDNEGCFTVHIPKLDKPFYVQFSFFPGSLATTANLYLLEPGDSINLWRQDQQYLFSGRGAAKLSCQYELNHTKINYYTPVEKEDFITRDVFSRWTIRKQKYDSVIALKKVITDRYKKQLSPTAYSILSLNNEAREYAGMYQDFLLELYLQKDPEKKKILQNFYNTALHNQQLLPRAETAMHSKTFAAYALNKARLDLSMELNIDKQKTKIPLGYFIDYLNTNYKSPLRDKLSMALFSELFGGDSTEAALLKKEIDKIQNKKLKETMISISKAKTAGMPAYNFTLPDMLGKKVSLSQFKGKVVVADFWFTGCTQCIKLAPHLEKIEHLFNDNKKVAFLSICTDADKQKWLTSVKGGKYTSSSVINLYTDGLGAKHPLCEYYGYQGFPQLLMIDKEGKLITAKPSYPTDENSFNIFVNLINKALQ